MSTGRKGPLDWADLQERMRDFYAYAFLPPSYTNDDFGNESETESEPIDGPQKPPAEARVVTDPDTDEPSVTDDALETARIYTEQSRERANDFYEYAFLPPSYTNDDFGGDASSDPDVDADDFDGFVFSDWLDAGRQTGPQKPPAEARVVTDTEVTTSESIDQEQDRRFAFVEWLESEDIDVETTTQQTPEPATEEREYGEFAFVEWLDSGESGFEPINISHEPAEPVEEPATPEPESESPRIPRLGIKPHPAKAATYALFLAVLTLAILSVIGYAPVLGPATGLGG